jgi:hypothetical protein
VPVSEYERHQVFNWFEEHMGSERAATMMNLVPPVGWAEIATKHDLAELEDRLTARFDARFGVLDGRFEALESRFDSKLDRLRSDLQRTFVTWLFLSQAAVIAAVGVLLALLR